MRIYRPNEVRDAVGVEYGSGSLLNTRFNNRASIGDLYSAMEPGYGRGTGYRPAERSNALENRDLYNSQGAATPFSREATSAEIIPGYEPLADYSALSRASRAEQQAAREIENAMAEVSRQRDTEAPNISGSVQDKFQDNQDTQDQDSQVAQDTGRYDWLDDYDAWLNGSENSNVMDDTQDIDSGLESLLDNTDTDIYGTDTLDDMQDSDIEEDEEMEQDVEYFQY